MTYYGTKIRIRGRPLIIWGAWCRFSRTKLFFFRRPSEPNFYFFAKIDRRNFFLITWFYRKNAKKIFFTVKLTDRNFFFRRPLWRNFFFRRPLWRIFFFFGDPPNKIFFFVLHHAPPPMFNGRPLRCSCGWSQLQKQLSSTTEYTTINMIGVFCKTISILSTLVLPSKE